MNNLNGGLARHLNKQKKNILSLTLIVAFLTVASLNCEGIANLVFRISSYGPISLEEAQDIVGVPLHTLELDKQDRVENLIYYYYDNDSELVLHTYFTVKNPTGDTIRVAKLLTFNFWSGISLDEAINAKNIDINWGSDTGRTCNVQQTVTRNEHFSGESYQSCIYWYDADRHPYKLLTIWSENETVRFANSLIAVEKDS